MTDDSVQQGQSIPLFVEPDKPAAKVTQSQREGGKKRKVAVFIAFVGAGYSVCSVIIAMQVHSTAHVLFDLFSAEQMVGCMEQGMQHNPGCKTIEGELGKAMNKAGAISNENAGEFSKVQGDLLSPLTQANAGPNSLQPCHQCFPTEQKCRITGALEPGGSHRQGSQRSGQCGVAKDDDRLPRHCRAHQCTPPRAGVFHCTHAHPDLQFLRVSGLPRNYIFYLLYAVFNLC